MPGAPSSGTTAGVTSKTTDPDPPTPSATATACLRGAAGQPGLRIFGPNKQPETCHKIQRPGDQEDLVRVRVDDHLSGHRMAEELGRILPSDLPDLYLGEVGD